MGDLGDLFARDELELGSRRARLRYWREGMGVVVWSFLDRGRRLFERGGRWERGHSRERDAEKGSGGGEPISRKEPRRPDRGHMYVPKGPRTVWSGCRPCSLIRAGSASCG